MRVSIDDAYDVEDGLVFDGDNDDLTWWVVARTLGVKEARYSSRITSTLEGFQAFAYIMKWKQN